MAAFNIADRKIGIKEPVYFIADIAANHDGDLSRAKDLISLAKEAGANAVKFQHFQADKIVSKFGFESMGAQLSHQKKWKKSVYEIYQDASLDWNWTEELVRHCNIEQIHFFSSPYDFGAVDMLDAYVPAFKIGSGDITWHEIILHIAKKNKPVLLATGASSIDEVKNAMDVILRVNNQTVVMQCNTNYTDEKNNFNFISLNVLKLYSLIFPDSILGLSDHTPGHSTVLGAVALGARVIEKHFTDDNNREGPDHPFSMNPKTWSDMVERSRELEAALGSAYKTVQPNELDTIVVQRRCLRANKPLAKGHTVTFNDISSLRPAPSGSMKPYDINDIIDRKLTKSMEHGEHFTRKCFL